MSKPVTHVAIVLDRSGSMASIKQQAIQNYNEQIQQMKENSKDQDIFTYLVTFNGNVVEHLWGVKAENLEEADQSSYRPDGATALYDAVGFTINKLKETTKEGENVAYLMVIISDGEENSSAHYSQSSIKEMIEAAQKTGKWTFSYMGCSKEYLERVSRETSIPLANMGVWSNENAQIAKKSLTASNNMRGAYFSARGQGVCSTSNLYSDDDSQCADFTEGDLNQVDHVNQVLDQVAQIQSAAAVNHAVKGKRHLRSSSLHVAPSIQSTAGKDIFSNGNAVSWSK